MNSHRSKAILAIAVSILMLLSCQVSSPLGAKALLDDDFSGSDSEWGTGTDAESTVEYLNDALNIAINKENYFAWSTPDDESYENVHIETTALNSSSDLTGAFGIICGLQVTDTSYYFAITGSGEYGIGRNSMVDDVLITNDGQWEKSSAITPGASSYRIGADCGSDGTLSLYVDGQLVDTVNDTMYPSGGVALFAWSGGQPNGTNVSFDDFIVTKLK